jgi:hypothetical protein
VLELVLENKRMDITDRIVGKLAENHVDLYDESTHVGRIVLSAQGNQYELKEGYEQGDNKIYKYVDVTTHPDQKYVDCDQENGWC